MKGRALVIGIGLALALALAAGFGFAVQAIVSWGGAQSTVSSAGRTLGAASGALPESMPSSSARQDAAAPAAAGGASTFAPSSAAAPPDSSSAKTGAAVAKQLIVTNAAISLRVKSVNSAVDALRKLSTAGGIQIESLTYSMGDAGTLPIQPLASDTSPSGSRVSGGQPSAAQITLRVPADRLDEVRRTVEGLGVVQSESSSQDDVTAQHVDMQARLKNMVAEEARLRALYARAGSVSSLLEVEDRLSNVRGDIESAQAQIAYLERQAALSTLQISLSEPGSLVRPSAGTSWGITAAATLGIQAAVAIVRALLTGVIALSPLVLLVLIAWGLVRLIRRIRRSRTTTPED